MAVNTEQERFALDQLTVLQSPRIPALPEARSKLA
jgi:hypothetical protein